VGPINISSCARQKSWSVIWAVVNTVVFLDFRQLFSFKTKAKIAAEPELDKGPKDYYSPPLKKLSCRQVYIASVRVIFFGKSTFCGQFVLVREFGKTAFLLGVPRSFFKVFVSTFFGFGILCFSFLKNEFCCGTNSNQGPTDIFPQYTCSIFQKGFRRLPMLTVEEFVLLN